MTDLSLAPYFDDFHEDKGFHKLLFRAGRAVQVRELTQLQTVLQNQITRFAQNIFLDGTVVVPGNVSVDTKYEYVKLEDEDLSDIDAGATIVGNDSGLIAILIQKVDLDGSDPATLYIRYSGGGSGDGGRFQAGETLTFTNIDATSGSFTAAASAPTGTGTKVDLDKGIYFTKGVFAVATTQSLLIEKYGIPQGVQEVGLLVTEQIITSDNDSTLLDNANGTNNRNAPGADRLKYLLSLIKREEVEDEDGNVTEDYFTVVTLKDEQIIEALTRSRYAMLGDEMARRTYDESGNYTIDPFIVKAEEHPSDETKLLLSIDPGKAYVLGYEISKPISTTVELARALDTDVKTNSKVAMAFGNYVRISAPTHLPDISTFESLSLKDSGNTTRGTARVRAIIKENGVNFYRVYLFDVAMDNGYGFNVVRTIVGAAFTGTIVDLNNAALSTNIAQLYDTDKNSLLFPIAYNRVKSLQDITTRVQRRVTGTTDGAGAITLDTSDSSVTFEDTASWIITRNDTGALDTVVTFGSTGAQTINITGLQASQAHTFIVMVDKTSNTTNARTKTLTTVSASTLTPGGGGTVALGQFDIYELVSVLDVAASDADITHKYILDNGQRSNYYSEGRLLLKANETAPAGNVKVTFKYFAHGPGAYFNADSYNSFVADVAYTYADIPTFVSPEGDNIRLADVLDFRPKKNIAGTFSGSGAYINELPKNNETLQADIEYYLPRMDVLYLDSNGQFGFVTGNPSTNPKTGPVPANAMPIYNILLNAGTLNEKDLRLSFVENRRYTMRDIGRIESRISRVEEWATLSLLETRTDSLEVIDNDGNARFKSGFFVDNFKNHAFADSSNPEYRAAIDPQVGYVRPTFAMKNIQLLFKTTNSESVSSDKVVRRGDVLMLQYDEAVELTQPLASSTINVNPYSVFTGIGLIILSPDSDEWMDVVSTTNLATIQETGVVNPVLDTNWNNWEWNWLGWDNSASNRWRIFDIATVW